MSGSYIFRISSHSRHSPHRSACSLQTFFCKALTSSTGSPMHFATVSGGIPSARKLLATDSAFSAAPSARPPYPQVLQGHLCVARLSGTGVKSVSCRCPGRSLARRPCSQVPHGHLCVPKGSSGRTSARHPSPQVRQRHPRVAKGPSGRFLARHPTHRYLSAILAWRTGNLLTLRPDLRPCH